MSASLRFSLLGIALMLFGVAVPFALAPLLAPIFNQITINQLAIELLALVFPLAGLILALIGFFRRD